MPVPPFNSHGFLPDGEYQCCRDEVFKLFGMIDNPEFRFSLYSQLDRVFNKIAEYPMIEGTFYLDDSFISKLEQPEKVALIFAVDSWAVKKNQFLYTEFIESVEQRIEEETLCSVSFRIVIRDSAHFKEEIAAYKIISPSAFPNIPNGTKPFKKGIVKMEAIV